MIEQRPEDEFDCFEKTGDLLAFCHQAFGPDGLREVLRHWLSLNDEPPAQINSPQWKTCRERVLGFAEELKAINLNHVANIVIEEAQAFPALEDLCPFKPEYETEVRVWKAKNAHKFGQPWVIE
jgi:hypothetical protein